MMTRKPTILYYDNGQAERRMLLEKAVSHMGIALLPIAPSHFLQTVGYLAKVKGFPVRKLSPLEAVPDITQEVMVLCHFTEQKLDLLLAGMKSGNIPHVPLKAVLTAQNCFWTFAQLFRELEEEHRQFYSE